MTIPAAAQGAEFETRKVTVTARMALAYAAALGCTQEQYVDDARPAGLIAPPPYCVSLEWMLSGDRKAKTKLGIGPEDQLRAVHTGQDTQFHRSLIAGETVSVSGRIEAVHATRAGTRVTSRFQVVGADANPISTSHCDAIYRGVETDALPSDKSLSARKGRMPDSEYRHATEIPISRVFPHIYSECASIWNPIHTERKVAIAAGLPDIIVHGTALWALVWKHLADRQGEIARLAGRFTAMAIPGQPVKLRFTDPDPESSAIYFRMDNSSGAAVIDQGSVVLQRN